MKPTANNEELLAKILEESETKNNDLKKENAKLTEEISQLRSKIAELSLQASTAAQSIITLEDHKKEIKIYKDKFADAVGTLEVLNNKYEKLKAERRYWATRQWAKHFFRWLFVKRHFWIWVVFMMFLFSMNISVFNNLKQGEKIKILQANDMKYRYVRAKGLIPKTLQFLDDSFEDNDATRLKSIDSTIREYERTIKMKSDSIVRAERKKTKDLR